MLVPPLLLLPEPERGSALGAIARLAIGPDDLERGTYASLAIPRGQRALRRIDQQYGCEPLCART